MIKTSGGFLSVGPSISRFRICVKAWRVGLGLRPSDTSFDCGKA